MELSHHCNVALGSPLEGAWVPQTCLVHRARLRNQLFLASPNFAACRRLHDALMGSISYCIYIIQSQHT